MFYYVLCVKTSRFAMYESLINCAFPKGLNMSNDSYSQTKHEETTTKHLLRLSLKFDFYSANVLPFT